MSKLTKICIGSWVVAISLIAVKTLFANNLLGSTSTIDQSNVNITGGNITVSNVTTTKLVATNGDYLQVFTKDIDLLATSTGIVVPAVSGKYFVPFYMNYVVVSAVGLTGDSVLTLGQNSPTYDDYSGSISFGTNVGDSYSPLVLGDSTFNIVSNTPVYYNLNTKDSTGTSGTVRIVVQGVYK